MGFSYEEMSYLKEQDANNSESESHSVVSDSVIPWTIQEMARVNTDILGISELKCIGMANLIQMTIVSAIVGKNPLEEME